MLECAVFVSQRSGIKRVSTVVGNPLGWRSRNQSKRRVIFEVAEKEFYQDLDQDSPQTATVLL